MGPVSTEVEIDVPRERVFEFVADLANRPSFTDHFVSDFHLTRIEPTGVGAGARFRVNVPLGSAWMDTAIAELDEPYRIVEHGSGGRGNRVRSTTVWELTEGPGSLTRVRVSHWTESLHPVDRVKEALGGASFQHERRWREALRRLRDGLESGASADGRVAVAGGNRYATGIP
jgi:uncharacterized protein YndB with AHSA1/START domain